METPVIYQTEIVLTVNWQFDGQLDGKRNVFTLHLDLYNYFLFMQKYSKTFQNVIIYVNFKWHNSNKTKTWLEINVFKFCPSLCSLSQVLFGTVWLFHSFVIPLTIRNDWNDSGEIYLSNCLCLMFKKGWFCICL